MKPVEKPCFSAVAKMHLVSELLKNLFSQLLKVQRLAELLQLCLLPWRRHLMKDHQIQISAI